jgi:predicted outer membrane protein
MKRRTAIVLAVFAVAAPMLFYGCGSAPTVIASADDEYSHADRVFIAAAKRFLLRQGQSTIFTLERSRNVPVKDFAMIMLKESSDALMRVNGLIQQSGISTDARVETVSRERFFDLPGLAFGYAYLRFVIEEHERAVAFCESEIRLGRNRALLEFANWLQPQAQRHLNEGYKVVKAVSDASRRIDLQESDPL